MLLNKIRKILSHDGEKKPNMPTEINKNVKKKKNSDKGERQGDSLGSKMWYKTNKI